MECYERDTWKVHHKILNYSTFPTKITVKLLKFLMQKTSKQKKKQQKDRKEKIADELNKLFINIGTDMANKIPNASNPFDSYITEVNTSIESHEVNTSMEYRYQ